MQYRLRHPSFTAPRGPPSPKIREKADKFVCASSLFSEYCLGYNLLLAKLEYFIEKVCDNSITSENNSNKNIPICSNIINAMNGVR